MLISLSICVTEKRSVWSSLETPSIFCFVVARTCINRVLQRPLNVTRLTQKMRLIEWWPHRVSVVVHPTISSGRNSTPRRTEYSDIETTSHISVFVVLLGHRSTSSLHAAVSGFGSKPDASEVGTEVTLGRRPPPPPRSLLQLQPLSWCRFRRRQRSGTVPRHGPPSPDGVPNETDRTEAAGPRTRHTAGKRNSKFCRTPKYENVNLISPCLLITGQLL